MGRPNLSPEQTTTVLAGLVPQATQVSAWTIEKLLAVHARMNEAGLPVDSLHTLVLAWLEQHDVRTLTNVDQLGWLFAQVQLAHRQDTGPQAFTVRWTGTLQPPVDGACTLSICPLRLNFRSGQTFRDESTKIFVAEQPVLDSAARWDVPGRPGDAHGRPACAAAGRAVVRLLQCRRDRRPAGGGPLVLGSAGARQATRTPAQRWPPRMAGSPACKETMLCKSARTK